MLSYLASLAAIVSKYFVEISRFFPVIFNVIFLSNFGHDINVNSMHRARIIQRNYKEPIQGSNFSEQVKLQIAINYKIAYSYLWRPYTHDYRLKRRIRSYNEFFLLRIIMRAQKAIASQAHVRFISERGLTCSKQGEEARGSSLKQTKAPPYVRA